MAEGHGFGLIVRYVNRGDFLACDVVSGADPHLDPEFCIEVGEGLIHEKHFEFPDDCSSHCNTLSLAA